VEIPENAVDAKGIFVLIAKNKFLALAMKLCVKLRT
jgi:hypothetical protein